MHQNIYILPIAAFFQPCDGVPHFHVSHFQQPGRPGTPTEDLQTRVARPPIFYGSSHFSALVSRQDLTLSHLGDKFFCNLGTLDAGI